MSLVSPAAVTRVPPRLTTTVRATLMAMAGNIPLVARLSTIFKEMIMVDVAVVSICALILWLYSYPTYYDLKLIRVGEGLEGMGVSSLANNHEGKMGLYYSNNWRVRHWGITFSCVSICFLVSLF